MRTKNIYKQKKQSICQLFSIFIDYNEVELLKKNEHAT